MKKLVFISYLLVSIHAQSQSVSGAWYGIANVKTNNSASNYMVELILQPEKNFVKGIINYYFKNTYRSLEVMGNYDPASRQLSLYDIPISYYGSIMNFEVDCIMNMRVTLRVAQAGSTLQGRFLSIPEFKYTCPEVVINLKLDENESHKDSVKKAIGEFKEIYQVWKPSADDTLVAVTAIPLPVINYVTEKEFTKRKNVITHEVEVESDSIRIDVYDNGEIDGDIISVFFNQKLILNNQKLTHKSIRINLVLDSVKSSNEISMFAENLGLIPPNTALMVIFDGKNKFEVPVSSSLEKNATISIKRKKEGIKAPKTN
ncbi:MAG: hypothetical protein ACRDEB_08935 [Chitinophagaceae bacterium]